MIISFIVITMEENETHQDVELEQENYDLEDLELDNDVEPVQEKKEDVDWKAAALRYKNKLKQMKGSQNNQSQERPTKPTTDKNWQEKIELQLKGYDEEEVAFIQKNGGQKALENPFVKAAVESIRQQKTAEKAVVDTDSTRSEVERKFSQEELQKMSAEELYKLLPKSNN